MSVLGLEIQGRATGGPDTRDEAQVRSTAALLAQSHAASSHHPIVMISTPLPPAMCGIGSYTAMLARHWPDPRDVTHVVTSGGSASRLANHCSPILEVRPSSRSLASALGRLPSGDVLLQYAARGFSRLGAPLWLLRALQDWRRRFPHRRLAVFIHELWADLPLAHRRGILERLSRWIIRELAGISDVVMTNTAHHQHRLQALLGGRTVEAIPVGANILPPGPAPRIGEREPGSFVIFGRAFGRVQALHRLQPHLQRWHAGGILRALHLVGPPESRWEMREAELMHRLLPPDVVRRHGALPDSEVSRLLSASRYALSGQSRASLMKSTTFMAFACHGCCVVDAEDNSASDEEVCRTGLLSAAQLVESPGGRALAEARAHALQAWYREHASWPVIAGRVAAAMARDA